LGLGATLVNKHGASGLEPLMAIKTQDCLTRGPHMAVILLHLINIQTQAYVLSVTHPQAFLENLLIEWLLKIDQFREATPLNNVPLQD
jgi:hypothetical protein